METDSSPLNDYQRRFQQFALQSAVRRLLPDSRVSKCLRQISQYPNKKTPLYFSWVKVKQSVQHKKTFFTGLDVCGSLWVCPVCAAKISERRKAELEQMLVTHRARGGELVMITRTVPHEFANDLKTFLTSFLKAEHFLKEGKSYRNLLQRIKVKGTVRVLEVTHGENGWHVHTHELWFVEKSYPRLYGDLSGLAYDEEERRYYVPAKGLFSMWVDSVHRAGFSGSPSPNAFGLHNGDYAAGYLAKWGVQPTTEWTASAEMTKSHIKTNARMITKNKGRTPFDLLRDFFHGDKNAGDLFKEFARVFKGRHQLQYSRGLKAQFAIEEKTDLEIAQEFEDHAHELGFLDYEDWLLILKHDARAYLLELAKSGWGAVSDYLLTIRKLKYV
ncbi:protein rep [Beggiatoa leptomitoformis]|uniref:Uncharacterized protein n=1 Tax=Beggiatoa leptomitoformis TaxID=288004 RepID=A0A2N9YCW2_9GAMM|nr:protein rep [Beggiatoa leptomitoformis]ALG66423.2 hypothetical protein AL038_00050 [Beggiatoa leptomitoformis]AUI68300.1 hypothetical protein BLE401_06020 [Beggiatoa leptomitoformis]